MRRAALVFALLAVPASSAVADEVAIDFDQVAAGAKRVANSAAISQLTWPFTGTCNKAEPGFDARQCRVLKRRARAQSEAAKYYVEVDAAITAKGDKLRVHGCLDCKDAAAALVIGPGKVVRKDGIVFGPRLKQVKRKTKPEVIARARTEFVFKLDSSGRPKLVGFRTYDPCTGDVLAADPPSGDRNPSKKCESDAAKKKKSKSGI